MRAQELAGRVTPGKATNDECWVAAPRRSKLPLKVSSPAMPLPFVGTRLLPLRGGLTLLDGEILAADELLAGDELPAAGDPAAAGEPDELQAATPTASVLATPTIAPLTTSCRYRAGAAGTGSDGYFIKGF
jgi:hypothetical protein